MACFGPFTRLLAPATRMWRQVAKGVVEPFFVSYDAPEPTYYFNDGGKGTGTREVGRKGQ
jgi:hypothetical protein